MPNPKNKSKNRENVLVGLYTPGRRKSDTNI